MFITEHQKTVNLEGRKDKIIHSDGWGWILWDWAHFSRNWVSESQVVDFRDARSCRVLKIVFDIQEIVEEVDIFNRCLQGWCS